MSTGFCVKLCYNRYSESICSEWTPHLAFKEGMAKFCVVCPDRNCRCLWNRGDTMAYNSGKSLECIGEMKNTVVNVVNEVEHINDLCQCSWTPRGWVRFEVNKEDLFIIKNGITHVLNVLKRV